ncbi:MAG TPA: hypothetical protein VG106_15980 [Vicinamibacterales bacterium]|nr:hypothetical protein [Vicinamibacterales bacterium]
MREFRGFTHEIDVADPHSDPWVMPISTVMLDPWREITSATHHMASLLLIVAVYVAWAAAIPSVAPAAGFKTCKGVRVDLGIIRASVSQRNTSCQFARYFVRRHRLELCSMSKSTIHGWRKTISVIGEGLTCTLLRKGSKAIRTNACGA